MKPVGVAALSQIADLHPASAFAPSARAAHPARPSLWQRIVTWHQVARERRRLIDLDDRTLEDIGLTRDQAHREASRPFWDHSPLR